MTPTEALDALHGALPADPDDHGPVAVPSDALRTVIARPVFHCRCGARIAAIDNSQLCEPTRFPESYIPGDHIDPCTCEVE